MNILICETYVRSRGHYKSYIDCILRYYNETKNGNNVYFLFNSYAAELIPELSTMANVHLIDEKEIIKARNTGPFKALRIAEYKLIVETANKLKIDRLIMLNLDQFQVAIFLNKVSFKITGIYFRPYHNIKIIENKISATLSNFLNFTIKYTLEKLLLARRYVEPVFLLNDHERVTNRPKHYRYLPDPIINYAADENFDPISKWGISKDSLKVLVFGGLNYRKNIEVLLDAFANLQSVTNVTLLLIGPAEPDYLERLNNLIAANSFFKQNENKVVVYNKFVTDGEMEVIFAFADIAYLAYKDFYGSSGLMGRAAKYNKPCIVPKNGLMAHLCAKYNLGVAVSVNQPAEVARAIENLAASNLHVNGTAFVNNHQEKAFVSTLLS